MHFDFYFKSCSVQLATMPPKAYINLKNLVKQEGRVLLTVSALKKRKSLIFIKLRVSIICLILPSSSA